MALPHRLNIYNGRVFLGYLQEFTTESAGWNAFDRHGQWIDDFSSLDSAYQAVLLSKAGETIKDVKRSYMKYFGRI